MYLYRALNDLEVASSTGKNGIIGKLNYKEAFENSPLIDLVSYELNVNKKTLENIRKDLMLSNIELFLPLAQILVNEKQTVINHGGKIVDGTLNYDKHNTLRINRLFAEINSTINSHITKGSTVEQNWISFSLDKNLINNFYSEQKINEIAVLDLNLKNCAIESCGTDYVYYHNLSSSENISSNNTLITQDMSEFTKKNYRGFNYAMSKKEVIFYNYVPASGIKQTLRPMTYDLLFNNLLNEEYFYNLSPSLKIYIQRYFIYLLTEMFENDKEIIQLITEHYKQFKSIKTLCLESGQDKWHYIWLKEKITEKLTDKITETQFKNLLNNEHRLTNIDIPEKVLVLR